MILRLVGVADLRKHQSHSNLLLTCTRNLKNLPNPGKKKVSSTSAWKLWKLWPIPFLVREQPKPTTFLQRLYGASFTHALVERSLALGGVTLLLFGIFYGTHISETPVTHRKRFVMFSPIKFEQVSDEVFNTYVMDHKRNILSSRNHRYKVVERVANQIVQSNLDIPEVLHKDWTVTVVNEPSYNIFALPTGQILVYEGMLSICKTDDQLAAVLGHELAHAILGHTAEMANQLGVWDKVWMAGAMVLWSLVPFASNSMASFMARKMQILFLNLPYNQLLEQEADKVGLQMLAKACYDVRECSAFWGRMETIQRMNYEHKIQWLYIHPDINRHRSKTVDRFLPEALRIRAENKCPPLSLHDPREDVPTFREEIERKLTHTEEPHTPTTKFEDVATTEREVKGEVIENIEETTISGHVQGIIKDAERHLGLPPQVPLLMSQVQPSHAHDHVHNVELDSENTSKVRWEIHDQDGGINEGPTSVHAELPQRHTHDHVHSPDYGSDFALRNVVDSRMTGEMHQIDSQVPSDTHHVDTQVPGEIHVHEGHFHPVKPNSPVQE